MPKVCPVCGSHYPDSSVFCPTDGSSLRAADAAGDLIGSVVADRYLVTDLLGEGGMGKVFLARHVRLPLQAAIKVLRPELIRDPSSVARFNREAANAASIVHERVARVFDFGETSDGLVYLAMEYVDGPTLKELLADGPLDLARCAQIIGQVADGLDAAHRMGIIHRDLKPDNILVHVGPDGEYSCKVVDFGIAKAVGAENSDSALTLTGFVVGTPEFMSPEQFLAGELDARSDVYALALTAFHCLTLELPFDSGGSDHGLTARLVSAPRSLRDVRPETPWPPALEAAFAHALQRDPAHRTESAGDFARAFESVLLSKETAQVAQVNTHAVAAVLAPVPTPSAGSGAETGVSDSPRRVFGRTGVVVSAASLFLLIAAALWWNLGRQTPGGPAVAVTGLSDSVRESVSTDGARADTSAAADNNSNSNVGDNSVGALATGERSGSPASAVADGGPPASTANGTRAASKPPATPTAGTSRTATLNALKARLDPQTATGEDAQMVVDAIPGVLVRLRTAGDSSDAYILAAEAHLLLEDVQAACAALDAARVTARTPVQAEKINIYTGNLQCRSPTW